MNTPSVHVADRPDGRSPQPGTLVMATVAAVTRELAKAHTAQQWASTGLFVPDAEDRVAPTKLDHAIIRELPYLIQICHQPLDRLGVERDVVPAARARRVPVEGLQRLASHREDWYGIAHGRVHPRRLISLTYVENLDFYENQVAAQLVDRLRSYLVDRLADLRDLEQHLTDLSRYEQALHKQQSVWKLRRTSIQLAGVARGTDEPSQLVAHTVKELQRAHSTILALRSSPTYRAANRRTRLPIRLRRTNLLSNNDRYYHVANLWDEWARNEVSARQAYDDIVGEFAEDYDTYVAALVLRACASVDLVPAPADAPAPRAGMRLELTHAGCQYTFTIAHNGTVLLLEHDRPVVRVLAIEHTLTREKNTSKVWRDLQHIWASVQASPIPTIVAYPGLRTERDRLPAPLPQLVNASGTLRAFGAPPALGALLPITPFEIEGIERMARALRWVLQARPMLERYPYQVQVPSSLQASGDWLKASGRSLAVVRRPTVHERDELLDEVRRHLAARTGMPTARRANQDPATELDVALDAAGTLLDLLERCPVCTGSSSRFEPRADAAFHCWCTNCKAQWGTRGCRSCGQKFPVLWPTGVQYTGDDGDQLDAAFGQDLLALPCATSPDGNRFRCPWCGRCQGAPSCGCRPPERSADTP